MSDSSDFVAFKDRRKAQITSSKEVNISASVLEDAEGLVLRKPKEMGQKSNTKKRKQGIELSITKRPRGFSWLES